MTLTFRSGQGLSFHELNRLAAAIAGTYIFPNSAGGAVTASSGMTVAVAAITGNLVTINGTVQSTNYAGGTVTAGASSSTLTRIDTVYYDGTATVAIAAGTAVLASATVFPVPPTLAAGQIALANIWIGIGATTIAAGDIDDRRSGVIQTIFRQKSAETQRVNNSTTLVNDDALSFPVASGDVWAIDLYSRVITNAAADFKSAWDVPAASTIVGIGLHHDSVGGTATVGNEFTADITAAEFNSASAGPFIHMEHVLVTVAATGTIQYQWAQTAATVVDTYVRTSSYLVARKVVG